MRFSSGRSVETWRLCCTSRGREETPIPWFSRYKVRHSLEATDMSFILSSAEYVCVYACAFVCVRASVQIRVIRKWFWVAPKGPARDHFTVREKANRSVGRTESEMGSRLAPFTYSPVRSRTLQISQQIQYPLSRIALHMSNLSWSPLQISPLKTYYVLLSLDPGKIGR